jgi:alpha-mannosidase
MAKYEVCAHKWVDISESNFGVALLNDCKYGHKVHGTTLDLNLLRSPHEPDPTADRARHEFSYAIYPHEGNHVTGGVVRAGYEFNMPLRQMEVPRHKGNMPATASLIETDNPNIVVEAVKKAQDSNDLIVRMYECHGGRTTARLRLGIPVRKAALVTMLEENAVPVASKGGSITLAFGPYEILSLRITCP